MTPRGAVVVLVGLVAFATPAVVCAQAVGQPGQVGALGVPLPPPPEAEAPKKPEAPAAPVEWWCEVNAIPAADSVLTPDQASRNFFMSQIIARHARAGPDEQHDVTRLCRTAFEVQFGGLWRLVTARAQRAPTVAAAKLDRQEDLRIGGHEGHVQEFRIPD